MKRNIENRILTIYLDLFDDWNLYKFNEVVSFIKANNQHIKLQFKLKMSADSTESLKWLMKSINIIEINVYDYDDYWGYYDFSLSDSYY